MLKRILILSSLILAAGNSYSQGNIYTYPPAGVTGLSNSGGNIVSTVPLLLPDGTAANPALGFANEVNLGIYRPLNNILCFGGGGQCQATIQFGTLSLKASSQLAWSSSTTDASVGKDLSLLRDAADTLALRRQTNPQTFNIYNTYTDATTWERAGLEWNTNVFRLNLDKGSVGGSYRTFALRLSGFNALTVSNTVAAWTVNQSVAGLMPAVDDTYTIGVSNPLTFTHLYLSRSQQGSKSKSLTDAGAAVSIERVAIPTNGYAGMFTYFTANSTDGTNRLTTSGLVTWAGADTAGTPTCGTPVVTGLVTAYKRANTLLCTFSTVTATTNCDLQVTCTDNLAGTQTMTIEHFLMMPTINTYTPQ